MEKPIQLPERNGKREEKSQGSPHSEDAGLWSLGQIRSLDHSVTHLETTFCFINTVLRNHEIAGEEDLAKIVSNSIVLMSISQL